MANVIDTRIDFGLRSDYSRIDALDIIDSQGSISHDLLIFKSYLERLILAFENIDHSQNYLPVDYISEAIRQYVKAFNSYYDRVVNFAVPGAADRDQISRLMVEIQTFMKKHIYYNIESGLEYPPPYLLMLYNSLQSHSSKNSETIINTKLIELDTLRLNFNSLKKELEDYTVIAKTQAEELTRKVSEVVIADYARYFEKASSQHSSFDIKFDRKGFWSFIPSSIKVGQADRYLYSGIALSDSSKLIIESVL